MAPAFARSSDFAIDKPAGTPCHNLREDFRCGIHTTLRTSGFIGCTVFDCFGAGQQISQSTFAGHDWRTDRPTAQTMFNVFPVMRNLHELLWYLTEAIGREETSSIRTALVQATDRVRAVTRSDPDQLLAFDIDSCRRELDPLLTMASELVRASHLDRRPTQPKGKHGNNFRGRDYRGQDLAGASFANADLRGARLRGTILIGATLTGADLRDVDFLGADLRGADLRRADLRGALFLTQFQVNAAKGDAGTAISPYLDLPQHWRPSR